MIFRSKMSDNLGIINKNNKRKMELKITINLIYKLTIILILLLIIKILIIKMLYKIYRLIIIKIVKKKKLRI